MGGGSTENTLKRWMPTNIRSCWKEWFSGVASFLAFFIREDTETCMLHKAIKLGHV